MYYNFATKGHKRRSVYKWNVCLYIVTQATESRTRETESYVDSGRMPDARFEVKGFQEDATTDDSSPKAQLVSLRVLLYYCI